MSAFTKDILRTVRMSLKRFLAIVIITTLGMTAFAGVNAACIDIFRAADRFYDQQNLFDIQVLSTQGLTGKDIEALKSLEEVELVEGAYSEEVNIMVDSQHHTAQVIAMSELGLNAPYLEEGELPTQTGEIAVTAQYLDESGKSLGDTLSIEEVFTSAAEDESDESSGSGEEAEKPTFSTTEFTITGIVVDPMDVSSTEGTSAHRSSATTDYTFFITPKDVKTEYYTAAYLTLSGLSELDCYSDEYKDAVQATISHIEESIKDEREQARYDQIKGEARDLISDSEATMNQEFATADGEISDAWSEIQTGRQELSSAEQKLVDGQATLNNSAVQLQEGKQTLAQKRTEAEEGFAEAKAIIASKQSELDYSRSLLAPEANQLKSLLGAEWPEGEWNTFLAAATASSAQMIAADPSATPDSAIVAAATQAEQSALSTALDSRIATQAGFPLDSASYSASCIQVGLGLGVVEGGQQALYAHTAALAQQEADAFNQLALSENELAVNEAQLIAAQDELNASWPSLEQGAADLAQGEAELVKNETAYNEKKTDATAKISDAYEELDDIERTRWYVLDRTSLSSYSGIESDISSIEAIGTAFPLLFLIVAILISLTTMTRMVEEERGLIGTYKALGYKNRSIAWKYLCYALLASGVGCVIGSIVGFVVLPTMLIDILEVMYIIPNTTLHFDPLLGLLGTALFIGSIVVSTALACRSELKESPAALMRPKSPRAGSRILLERIPFIWKKLKFLNKVTARNLFRYKKRFFMTLIGIAGCTALVLAGFAIKDSVSAMQPKQYEEVYQYELMLAAEPQDNDELVEFADNNSAVESYISAQIENAKVINAEGATESVQMIVVPTGSSLETYIATSELDGSEVSLDATGVLLTQNAAALLGLQNGDTIALQNMQLDQFEVEIDSVVKNYLGNNVFITQEHYESLFGEYEPNAMYAHLTDEVTDQSAYAEELLDEEFIVSSVSTTALEEGFSSDFVILNYVIMILVVLAAGLAFVVLFTLSNTNISERARELATIKVLGFYDREVHSYVNKETLILTFLSVLCGLPLGFVLSDLLLAALKMPSIQFELTIEPLSYLIAAVIAFSFALIVNLMTNPVLDKINMVEALKSVE